MMLDDRLVIVAKLRDLALLEAANGDGDSADATAELADRFAAELHPANLSEAIQAFVEAALFLDDIWFNAQVRRPHVEPSSEQASTRCSPRSRGRVRQRSHR
jgi:hypothetical protein